jgi:hypothetical protein
VDRHRVSQREFADGSDPMTVVSFSFPPSDEPPKGKTIANSKRDSLLAATACFRCCY